MTRRSDASHEISYALTRTPPPPPTMARVSHMAADLLCIALLAGSIGTSPISPCVCKLQHPDKTLNRTAEFRARARRRVTRPGGRIRRRITRRQRKRGWIARSISTPCRTSVRSVAASIDSSRLAAPCHVTSLFGTGIIAIVSGRARDQGTHLVIQGERPCSASAARRVISPDRHARRTPRVLISVRDSRRIYL